jgi:hypothetical protein
MKRTLLAFLLTLIVIPLLAQDEGGDGATIPNYRELVREGYGPRSEQRIDYIEFGYGTVAVPKPTQAYYGKGFTIYYGYTAVPVPKGQADSLYAFGYPIEYFRKMLPSSVADVNLNHYAVEVRKSLYGYGPGDYVAQQAVRPAVTQVQPVPTTTTATPAGAGQLPAIGEKPSQTSH